VARAAGDTPARTAAGRGGRRGGPELDPLVHERVRLGILSALAVSPKLDFGELAELLAVTPGNLSAHARKLEEAGYLTVRKHFVGRHPRTEFRLAPRGRSALERYLDQMEALIRDVRAPAPGGDA